MSYENILVETLGEGARKTGLIRLNRPKALNALSDPLMDELGAALQAFDADRVFDAGVIGIQRDDRVQVASVEGGHVGMDSGRHGGGIGHGKGSWLLINVACPVHARQSG